MSKKKNQLLLAKYFRLGWLKRRYFDGEGFCQPYSAEDRLRAGTLFYLDYLVWNQGNNNAVDYSKPKVDGGLLFMGMPQAMEAERFRRALRRVSKQNLAVVYKIVLEEKVIAAPGELGERERLYFNEEIKGLLCRGLDELCGFYRRREEVYGVLD